jgi:hypothetical protein
VPAPDPLSTITLPFSTTTSPVPVGMPRVLISRQAIALAGDSSSLVPLPPPDRWANGVDAAYKRGGPDGLYLVPLAAALTRAGRGDGAPLAVGVDASVPYRVLIEVLFTARQSGYERYHLLARTAAGFGAVIVTPPTMSGRRLEAPITPSLNLAVLVVSAGIALKASGGNIAPGCAGVGPGITLPRGPGGLDLAGLRACAAAARQSDPRFAQETQAIVIPNPDTPFSEIVAVMDALRVEPSGREGFPDIHFGIAR